MMNVCICEYINQLNTLIDLFKWKIIYKDELNQLPKMTSQR